MDARARWTESESLNTRSARNLDASSGCTVHAWARHRSPLDGYSPHPAPLQSRKDDDDGDIGARLGELPSLPPPLDTFELDDDDVDDDDDDSDDSHTAEASPAAPTKAPAKSQTTKAGAKPAATPKAVYIDSDEDQAPPEEIEEDDDSDDSYMGGKKAKLVRSRGGGSAGVALGVLTRYARTDQWQAEEAAAALEADRRPPGATAQATKDRR